MFRIRHITLGQTGQRIVIVRGGPGGVQIGLYVIPRLKKSGLDENNVKDYIITGRSRACRWLQNF